MENNTNIKEDKKFVVVENLEKIVKELLKRKEEGIKVWTTINGHTLCSKDITWNSAYLEVTGYTKDEYDKLLKEHNEAIKKTPSWIERGSALIYKENIDKWEKCIHERVDDLYSNLELDATLEALEEIDRGILSYDSVKKNIEEAIDSKVNSNTIYSIIFNFSKKGPEFMESVLADQLNADDIIRIESKKEENRKLSEQEKQK